MNKHEKETFRQLIQKDEQLRRLMWNYSDHLRYVNPDDLGLAKKSINDLLTITGSIIERLKRILRNLEKVGSTDRKLKSSMKEIISYFELSNKYLKKYNEEITYENVAELHNALLFGKEKPRGGILGRMTVSVVMSLLLLVNVGLMTPDLAKAQPVDTQGEKVEQREHAIAPSRILPDHFSGNVANSKDWQKSTIVTLDVKRLSKKKSTLSNVAIVQFTDTGVKNFNAKFDYYLKKVCDEIAKQSGKDINFLLFFTETGQEAYPYVLQIFKPDDRMLGQGFMKNDSGTHAEKALKKALGDVGL